MTSDEDRAALMLDRLGLSTEAIGPLEEWAPAPRGVHQVRHDTFWRVVTDVLPDDENDEAYWMTQQAAHQLRDN